MLEIKGTTIILTRGDTAWLQFPLYINVPGEEKSFYSLADGDSLQLILRECIESDPCMEKVINTGETIHITPEDTAKLPLGSYVYDVRLTMASGDVYTPIRSATFILA